MAFQDHNNIWIPARGTRKAELIRCQMDYGESLYKWLLLKRYHLVKQLSN